VRHGRKKLPSSAVLLIAVVALALGAQSGLGQTMLRKIGLSGQPVRYTELALVDPSHPLTTLTRTPRALRLRFSITNREHRTTTYRWTLIANGGAIEHGGAGTITLGSGHRSYVFPRIIVACRAARTELVIGLSTGEQLTLWTTCTGPAKAYEQHAARARASHRAPATRPRAKGK
jgi:hypothetical protein